MPIKGEVSGWLLASVQNILFAEFLQLRYFGNDTGAMCQISGVISCSPTLAQASKREELV